MLCAAGISIELPEEQTTSLNVSPISMTLNGGAAEPSLCCGRSALVREWPEHITLATVGEGTAKVIRAPGATT